MATEKRHNAGPADEIEERRTRIESLPEAERDLARESGRFADLCNYLSQQHVDVPAKILDDLGRVAKLDVPQRTVRMKALNEELMKFISDVGLGGSTAQ